VICTAVVMPAGYVILLHQLSVPFSALFARVWRPLAAVAVMVVGVRQLAVRLPEAEGTLQLLVQLGGLVFFGVVAYFATIGVLWLLAGRPDGAERYGLDRVMLRAAQLPGRSKA
jgi:hypothetical protein